MVPWRPTRPFRTNTQKRCPFHYRGLECKSMKSRNTWSNRQIWPWNMEWSRAKTNRVWPRKCTGHSKHPLPTKREDSTHGHHQMVNTKIRLIIFFATKDGEALCFQQNQDRELTLPRKCTGYSKHPLPTTHEKTLYIDITRWSTPKSDWLYSLQPKMEKLYTVNKNKTRSWLWLRSWTPYYQIQT